MAHEQLTECCLNFVMDLALHKSSKLMLLALYNISNMSNYKEIHSLFHILYNHLYLRLSRQELGQKSVAFKKREFSIRAPYPLQQCDRLSLKRLE